MSGQISVDNRPMSVRCLLSRTWPPMLGTPVDSRPDIGRYLNDVSKMGGRLEKSVETSGDFNSELSLSDHLPMLPESPGHRTMTTGVRPATGPKWPQNTSEVHRKPNRSVMWPRHKSSFIFLKLGKNGLCTCHLNLQFTQLCFTFMIQKRYHWKVGEFVFNYMLHMNSKNKWAWNMAPLKMDYLLFETHCIEIGGINEL